MKDRKLERFLRVMAQAFFLVVLQFSDRSRRLRSGWQECDLDFSSVLQPADLATWESWANIIFIYVTTRVSCRTLFSKAATRCDFSSRWPCFREEPKDLGWLLSYLLGAPVNCRALESSTYEGEEALC